MLIVILHRKKTVAEALKWCIEFSEKKIVQCRNLNSFTELENQTELLITDSINFLGLIEKNKIPVCPVLLIKDKINDSLLIDALFAGVDAIANIMEGPGELLEKIKNLIDNKPDEIQLFLRKIIEASHLSVTEQKFESDFGLTPKEKRILKLLKEANHLKMIAALTNTSYETVRTHIKNIYKKIGVTSASEAVIKAMKINL